MPLTAIAALATVEQEAISTKWQLKQTTIRVPCNEGTNHSVTDEKPGDYRMSYY